MNLKCIRTHCQSLWMKGGTEHRWTFSVCGGLKRRKGERGDKKGRGRRTDDLEAGAKIS